MKSKRMTLIILVCFVFCYSNHIIAQDFEHPGVFNRESDFARMRQKVAEHAEPWYTTWKNLLASPEASLSWTSRATATVIRGGTGDNISLMYRDAAAAYQHALIYKISGDKAHGDKAAELLNSWSLINTLLSGNADRYLASGLDGYQFANAAELMRGYPGFNLERFKTYMLNVFFYPMNERFLIGNAWGAPHNDACSTNYRVNWDICNMNAMLAISILCDKRDGFNEVLNYCKSGDGTGNLSRAVNYIHSPVWGQWEESGRDQGHAVGGLSLYALFCEIAWNQGVDIYSYDDSRFRKGAEYVARYNILTVDSTLATVAKYNDLPYTSYSRQMGSTCSWYTESSLGTSVRGKYGSSWELINNHYAHRLNQGDKVKSISEILKQQPSTIVPSVAIHADTYDTPGLGSLTFCTDSGSYILPWLNMDISVRSITKLPYYGKSTLLDSTLTITGSGSGINGTADNCQFAYQKLVDDGSLVARLTSLEEVNALCQAGIMIRENLEQNSKNVFLSLSAARGVVFNSRDSISQPTSNIATNASINSFPYWLRLSRSGDVFTASVSPDQVNWTIAGSKTIKMNRLAYIGLAVSGNNANATSTAIFDKANVKQENMRPIVKISSPVSGGTPYVTPANVKISGVAYDNDGMLDKAEIYLNGNLVSTAKTSPFTYSTSGVTEGSYSVYVKAYDKQGAVQTSDTLTYTVNPVSNRLPWYKFDETKLGYSSSDASGNTLNATLYGGTAFAAGQINNCIKLDGVNDYVKVPGGFIEQLSDFTVSAWVKMDTIATWSRIFDFGSGPGATMFLTGTNGNGRLQFTLSGANVANQFVETSTSLPVKTWCFITVTLSGNKLNIYLNGTLVGSNISFTNRPYDLGATTTNYIGKSQYSSDPNFKGYIDDFRFYNYALTIDQIKSSMSLTPVDVVKTNPQLFYPNPASGKIHFDNAENSVLRIYDTMGKLSLQQEITEPNQSVDIRRLMHGVYIVKTIDKYSCQQQNRLIVK